MSRTIRGQSDAATQRADREYGGSKAFINLWDMSDQPNTNDRIKKLGKSFDTTKAGAIDQFDAVTGATVSFDGIHDRAGIMASRFLEPDNWLFRMHVAKGAGVDSVWASRLIADHSNNANSRLNRSTYVIDQCDNQRQGTLQDTFWGVDLETDVGDDELIIGGDGFTRMLAKDFGSFGAEEGVRLALANNIAKNAGYVTDGKLIGEFQHIFRLGKKGGEGGKTLQELCQPKEKRTLCLDGAVNFLVKEDLCHLGIKDEEHTDPECGQPYIGRFFVRDEISAIGATRDLAEDAKSNHKAIARDQDKSLWVVIRVPEDNNGTPTQSGAGGTATQAGTPTPTLEPTPSIKAMPPKRYSGDSTGSFRPGALAFEAGQFQVIEKEIPIRNPLEADTFLDVFFMVRPTAAYGVGESSKLTFMYRALPRGVDATAILFQEIDLEFDDTFTLITKDGWNQVLFRVPAADLLAADGGILQSYLFFRSDSSGPDLVLMAA